MRSKQKSDNLLILGFGYCAKFISRDCSKIFNKIYGTSGKTTSKFAQIIEFNVDKLTELSELLKFSHIIITIPPNKDGDTLINEHINLIDKLSAYVEHIIYFSSSSVYGDHEGKLVNEESALKPTGSLGRNRLRAEDDWRKYCLDKKIKLSILRSAAIYGPNRNALIHIKDGSAKSIYKENLKFSRIHVEDIAQIVKAVILMQNSEFEIYNLADDWPCPIYEVNHYAAKLLNLPPPEVINYENADLSPIAKEFYAESKIVDNNKIKEKLKIKLKYSNYKQGLKSLL